MNKKVVLLLASLLGYSSVAVAGKAEDVLPEIKALAALPEVVEAVKAQNGKAISDADIKALDDKWQAGQVDQATLDQYLASPLAKKLSQAEKSKPYFKEIIVTDNKGGNVAITDKTSDYWQGDEPKFVKAFADGAGADYIARPKRDDSSGEVIAQVSVPVLDGGKAIGTFTIGVMVDKLP